MGRVLFAGWAFLVLVLGAVPAWATGSRVALVIGNSAYQNVPFLPNPVNDAADLSAALKRLDFDVRTMTNARYDDMRRVLIDFGQQARGAEIAIIFFAGHGLEVAGENWLIPVDAQLATDLNIPNEAIGLQSFTRAVSNTTKLGLVILDSCRSNPFLPKMQSTNLTRAVDRGLSRVEPSDNVLVAYAARDGTTANDGAGRNSPFTQALLKNIETPGLEVRFLFADVRDDVMAATSREQQPFIYGSLSKQHVYLKATIGGEPSSSVGLANIPAAPAPIPSVTSYDPIGVARAFYLALSSADGVAASSLVVPEKRGSGPFYPSNITAFYSTLRDPLRILAIERVSDDLTKVKYRFVTHGGKACLGTAMVNTVSIGGKALIQGISANC